MASIAGGRERRRALLRASLCALILLVGPGCPLLLPFVRYDYVGEAYGEATTPYVTGQRLSGWVVVRLLLPDLEDDRVRRVFDFEFDDGVVTYDPESADFKGLGVTTDGTGRIEEWTLVVQIRDGGQGFISGSFAGDEILRGANGSGRARSFRAGSWSEAR